MNFTAEAAVFQTHLQAIEANSVNVPLVVDGGLPVVPTVEAGAPRRITQGEWNLHRQEIERQYHLMTLPELRQFMAKKQSFSGR
jgi:hypothetical protein